MRRDEAELSRLARVKHKRPYDADPIGPAMLGFFKQTVAKRQTKMSAIAEAWALLVPEMLSDHCSLESFTRGSLAVVVDSAPHLYELKQLLLAGLEKQLIVACKSSGLRKITLKRGVVAQSDMPAGPRRKRNDEVY